MTSILALRFNARDGRDGVDFNVETVKGTFNISREALEDLGKVESATGQALLDLFDQHRQSICQAAADLTLLGAAGNPVSVSYEDVLRAEPKVGGGQDIGG